MSDFLDYGVIKGKIETQVCSEHNEHPKFTKTTEGCQIDCCCENFKMILTEKIKKNITEQTKVTIQNMLKKAFKR